MNLKPIVFIDTEIEAKSGKVLDIGGVKGVGSSFHSNSLVDFAKFLYGSDYVWGHNIFNHDLKYIRNALIYAGINDQTIIDTLFLSPLLFPAKPYHKLVKDDKLQTEDTNNPLNDSIKAKDLFFDEIAAFQQTDADLQQIFYQLLRDQKEFSGFFHFLGYQLDHMDMDIEKVIREKFHSQICANSDLARIIVEYPIELSYCLALINTDNRYSITPPWVLKNYPAVERIMFLLRSCPCLTSCAYCDQALDVRLGLKRFFGFENYRTYAGEPLQENAVQAAVDNKSLLAVFPTGGGKSITFQVPALMSGAATNGLTIERLEKDNKKRYKVDDYQRLEQYYQQKVQQIHIVGEYARKMIRNYQEALQFVDDYFKLNYTSFLHRYFPGSREDEIKRNITPSKFKQLFGELSPTQLKIINDKESKTIVVAAGPGSGKTRILVHKLASLLLMEDVKHEQLLMVTFSRSAATEFKKRLLKLIGNVANYIEIKTFHSYCFDLLGRVGSLEKSGDIIQEAIKRIRSGQVEPGQITKTVLVIDEAQDMDAHEFALVEALMEQNDGLWIIAVGDDDQNIFEFRGASSKYMESLITEHDAVMVELVENYRSRRNLVEAANQFLMRIPNRLKHTPIMAVKSNNGKIKRVHFRSRHLMTPLVEDILAQGLTGSTCVLTKRNEEALQIAGLLMKRGRQAKLIQSNEGFNLYNLLEIRYFLSRLNLSEDVYIISDDLWENAKRRLAERFRGSLNLESCLNLIKDFEATNPKYKYKSDLEIFIRESVLEDFVGENMETIFVSTIHKAKGREFDNVFLMLDFFDSGTNEAKRQLYVAMTRAKNNLTMYDNGNYLNSIKVEDMQVIVDSQTYLPPQELVMQLSHRDVQLDFFLYCRPLIKDLNSGESLGVDGLGCYNAKGQAVLKFSHRFLKQIEAMRQKNYVPKTAKIRFVVYWQKENTEVEVRIVLPELYFEKILP